MIPIALASEFPNDNPSLHRGAIWVIESPCALPSPEPVEIRVVRMVEELVHDLVDSESTPTSTLALARTPGATHADAAPPHEPLSIDLSCEPSRMDVAAMCGAERNDEDGDYAQGDDEDSEPIEIVDDLDAIDGMDLDETTDAPELVPPDAFTVFVRTLAEVAVAAGASDAASAIADAVAREASASAWRAILNGESEDYAACGAKPLDEWAAELVARVIAAPCKSELLRRELRSRGVAAFGLVG